MLAEAISLLAQDPITFIWVIIGTGMGIIFGSIPGLTATMAIAICLPMTYSMSQVAGISMLVALYIGGISGGLISAILLRMPGTPSSIATTFDGYPMAQNGQADKALGGAIVFSGLSTIVSVIALILIAPKLAEFALKFGPYEYFAVTCFAMSLIITLSSDNLVKGLMSGVLGIMFATVGMDAINGQARYTFGLASMRNGFDILTVLVGLYALAEVFSTAEQLEKMRDMTVKTDFKIKGFGITMSEFLGQGFNFVRSFVIGLVIGILPGIGGGTSNIIAYTVAKNGSKTPEKFGTGILDGVVASETANNATIGGAMIPLLTLGIPGDTATAMLLGGLAIHGVSAGPLIFDKNGAFVYAIYIILIVSTIIMMAMEFFFMKGFVKVLTVPKNLLLPAIVVLCGIGAFGLNNRVFDMGAMLFFGLVGLLMSKLKFPMPPMILGFILGGTMEEKLRQGLSASQNDFSVFWTRPISGVLLVASIIFIIYSLVKIVIKVQKADKAIS